jgi:hypothetical protein
MLKVNEIKPTVVTSADERLVVSKNECDERASIICSSDSNNHVILINQPTGGDNYCGNGCHWCFPGLTSPEMGPVFKASRTERHQRRRKSAEYSQLSRRKSTTFAKPPSAGISLQPEDVLAIPIVEERNDRRKSA